jgi:uncharacterized HAD superfamily protein
MKKIGIDLDNTVSDFLNGAVPHFKELYGLEPDFSRKAFRLEEVFGITDENRPLDMRKRLYIERRLFRDLPTLEQDSHLFTWGLRSALSPLKIYFLTARDAHPVIKEDTRHWLDSKKFDYDDVFHTDHKAEFCKMSGITVMVEDELRQIVPLMEAGVDVIIMDQPWNRQIPEDPHGLEDRKGRLRRAHNWREAFVAAKELLG